MRVKDGGVISVFLLLSTATQVSIFGPFKGYCLVSPDLLLSAVGVRSS